MADGPTTFKGMTLFTQAGERKYLTEAERQAFLSALTVLPDPKDRTYCETLYWTGCRPSEALALSVTNIDVDEAVVIVRSLKKRGELRGRHFRSIPVPREFIEHLDRVHGICDAQSRANVGRSERLWTFGRTAAWERVKTVMNAAGLSGEKASAKGLRHAYGVHAVLANVPETRIKKWLGHASLATTEIYLDIAGPEDRVIAQRMWRQPPLE